MSVGISATVFHTSSFSEVEDKLHTWIDPMLRAQLTDSPSSAIV